MRGKDFILFLNDFNAEINHKRLVKHFLKTAKLVVYDWSDDFVEFFTEEIGREKTRRTCEEYIKKADVVLTVNNGLTTRAKNINSNAHTVLNATDFVHMSRACHDSFEIPKRLKYLSKPLLGYIGWIVAVRIDTEILKNVAAKYPECTIVLVGPVGQRFVELFQGIRNIVFLPPVDYEEIPRYLKFFDVCLIPHNVNEHTRGNNPIKIYDYLATGKPIVSTPVAGVKELQDLIYLAKTPKDFTTMVERALSEDSEELKTKRIHTASLNSWASRINEAWKIVERNIDLKNRTLQGKKVN
jgi:glycosyltransferase involved in cell wall biosynthesis